MEEYHKQPDRWKQYIDASKDQNPHSFTKDAISYVTTGNNALDFGAGALNEAKFLLEKGFRVTAVDGEASVSELAKKIANENLEFVHTHFEDYKFSENQFDLIIAFQSLYFFKTKEKFQEIFSQIYTSLKPGGVLAFDLLGNRDDFANLNLPDRILFSREEIIELIKDFTVLQNIEKEYDRSTKLDKAYIKHWHKFKLILKK